MVKKIIFITLIAIGIFFRVYMIEQVPGGLFGDEVSLAVNAKTIAQSGTDEYGRAFPFGFESFSDYKMPGYVYTSAAVFKVLGSSVMSIRFMAILSSILSIFGVGLLAKILFPKSKNISWYAMILLALSPYHIHFGRIAYETMLATTCMVGFFIAFLKSVVGKKKILWFFLGIILLFGACWTYPAPRFIIPSFLVLVAISSFFLKPKNFMWKQVVLSSVGYLLLSVVSFIPSILNPAMEKRPLGYIFPQGSKEPLLTFFVGKATSVVTSWLRSFNLEFLFDKGDVFGFRSGTKLAGLFLPITLPFFITGIFSVIQRFSRKEFSWTILVILFVVCGLPSALTWSVPYGPRFLPMLIPLTLLLAVGWDSMSEFLSRQLVVIRKISIALFAVVLIYQILWFADIYFIQFPILSQPEFPTASKELTLYLRDQMRLHPTDTIYYLEGRSCAGWRHEDLQLWYFADLSNKDMIVWNNKYRTARFSTGNPFDSYDSVIIPTGRFSHTVLYPSTQEMIAAPTGSLLVHCGITLKDLNPKEEHVEKVLYLYPDIQQDPAYVVSKKL